MEIFALNISRRDYWRDLSSFGQEERMKLKCNHLKVFNVSVAAICNSEDDCYVAYDKRCGECEHLEIKVSYEVTRA